MEKFTFSMKAKEKLRDKNFLREELTKGKSPQEIMEVSGETMTNFYNSAFHLFESHEYTDAANAFVFLISLNAHNYQYWLGLGMATQMSGNFEAAIDSYEMAAIYEVENPTPYFYLAKCLFAMHERQSAMQALEIALQYEADIPEYQQLKAQTMEAMELLKHTLRY
jgi:type III secretion system low calcium response chaperone LcrH/SycD